MLTQGQLQVSITVDGLVKMEVGPTFVLMPPGQALQLAEILCKAVMAIDPEVPGVH